MEYDVKTTPMTDSYSLWTHANNQIDPLLFFLLSFLAQVCYLVLLSIENPNIQKWLIY